MLCIGDEIVRPPAVKLWHVFIRCASYIVAANKDHRRRSRGGQGDRSPTFRTGDNPPLYAVI